MQQGEKQQQQTVHHHFTISHDGAPRRASSQPSNLRETQDLLLASGLLNLDRSSVTVAHEHRFHQLREDEDREGLKQRIREREPGKTHVFLDSFRSVDAIAGGPLSHLLQDVASVRRCLRWALRIELATVPPYIYALYSLKVRAEKKRERTRLSQSFFFRIKSVSRRSCSSPSPPRRCSTPASSPTCSLVSRKCLPLFVLLIASSAWRTADLFL